MGQGLVPRDRAEIGAPAERPSRCRQDESLDDPGRLGGDQLMQRRVLGIHRGDPGLTRLRQCDHELPADYQALLVGERQLDALAEGDDRRPEAGGADDRVEHDVRLEAQDQVADALLPVEDLPAPARIPGRLGGVRVGEGDDARRARLRLGEQLLPVARGGEAGDPELGGTSDDVDGLLADRAGRAEDQYVFHVSKCRNGEESVGGDPGRRPETCLESNDRHVTGSDRRGSIRRLRPWSRAQPGSRRRRRPWSPRSRPPRTRSMHRRRR